MVGELFVYILKVIVGERKTPTRTPVMYEIMGKDPIAEAQRLNQNTIDFVRSKKVISKNAPIPPTKIPLTDRPISALPRQTYKIPLK